MAEKQGIPLDSIDGFPEAASNRLAGLWITTAEELVSAARQEEGTRGLAEYLEMTEDEIVDLVEMAVAALPPGVSFAPDDIMEVGLGALDEAEGAGPEDEPVAMAPDLPQQVDFRDRMPPVRDQESRGTCVAHACVAVREYLLGDTSTQGDFSEQFLYWDCKRRDGHPTIEGTWIRVGMQCLEEDGVCVEQVWPYNPNPVPGDEGQGPPPAGAMEDAGGYRVESSTKLQPRWTATLRQTLADGKVVAFAVPVYRYWITQPVRSTGDIRMPLSSDTRLGGHAMALVGYQDDPDVPGGGFFIVRNSWGAGWASDSALTAGHARLPYEYLSQFGRSAFTATAPKDDAGKEDETFWDQVRHWWKNLFG
jgi:C1A family cysteine protease